MPRPAFPAGVRILIVDDEFMIAADIQWMLSDAGAEVAVTTSLSAALDVVRNEHVSAALLDVRLGNDTSEPVADLLAAKGIPFLFFSGVSLPCRMRAKFPDARTLVKPVAFCELLSATADLVASREPV
ncbi:MAG TPA: response regulator [Rudaea sp.]|nr:response regulator [Rudaea sp.]